VWIRISVRSYELESKLQLKIQKSRMLSVQPFTFNPLQENTYVVYNEKGACCIIDPGCYFAPEETALTAFINEKRLTPVLLLNTHCHLDHIFGNQFIYKTYGLTLQVHRLEEQVLPFGPMTAEKWGLPFTPYEGPLQFIEAGSTILIGEDELQVRFTPGHSPGSITFYNVAGGFVISGDVLFQGSIGRTDLPGGSFEVLERSIREQLYTLPPEVIVYSGHGEKTTIGKEMRSNPFVSAA
jgi:glyoxylase-like metal-dependent hydrolase (beta-lactamase superfamily II)